MNKQLLQDYARLVARKGLNVEKGEEVWITCQLSDAEFVRMVVEECYKAGAIYVRVKWSDTEITRSTYTHATAATLTQIPNYTISELKYRIKHTPSSLYIDSEDPEALKGLDQNKLMKVSMKTGKRLKKYREAVDGKYKWCIVGVPSEKWAQKVFPDLSKEEAVEKLWAAIFETSRVDGNDPVENWNKHNAFLSEKKNALNSMNLQYLIYKSSNGTDFKVELNEGVNWGAGLEVTHAGREFNPNIPSEEVFTSPKAGSCDGIVYATKPLSFRGQLIKDFSVRFENGKAVEVHAKEGEKLLEQMIHMDEGAAMLGEVALVPFVSPINNTGILFYSTLYDENACCHLALGAGFRDLVPNNEKLSQDDLKKMGINDSMIHVDFMIGSEDLSIVGVTRDGKEIQIFKDGNWAF